MKSLSQYYDPIYGWKPDTDFGDGAYTASAEDMKRFGKVNLAAILDEKGKVIDWQAYRREEDLTLVA